MRMLKKRGSSESLLLCGVIGPPLFIVVFLIEGATRPGYSAWQTHVSYLALSNQGWEQIANFLVCGLLCIAFAVGLRRIWRTGRASVWGPLLVGVFGLGLVIAGGCVADPGGGYPPGAPINGNPQTWHGWVHGIDGGLLFNVVLPAACFVLARRFAAEPQDRRWATYSWLTGALILWYRLGLCHRRLRIVAAAMLVGNASFLPALRMRHGWHDSYGWQSSSAGWPRPWSPSNCSTLRILLNREESLMHSSVTGAPGSVSDGRAQALLGASHTLMRWFVLHSTNERTKEKKPMASPREIYTAWQSRQTAGDVEHLGEVVDLEGFRDICSGLSDWITGYQAAFEHLKRNILIPLAEWHATVEAVVEGQDAVVVRKPGRGHARGRLPRHPGHRSPRELLGRDHGEGQGRPRGGELHHARSVGHLPATDGSRPVTVAVVRHCSQAQGVKESTSNGEPAKRQASTRDPANDDTL